MFENKVGWLVMLAVGAAIGLSVWVVNLLIGKLSVNANRGHRIGAYIGGYGTYPFALFLGYIVGGNFGGAFGDNVLGTVGTVIGIGLGIFMITIAVCSVGAIVGYYFVGFLYRE